MPAFIQANTILKDPPAVRVITFIASGILTIPSNATACKVTVVGSGGGADSSSFFTGSGGGVAIKYLSNLTPGSTINVTVGIGGALGSAGNSSSIYSGTQTINTVSATGGAIGLSTITSGGTGSGGDINLSGQYGGTNTGYPIGSFGQYGRGGTSATVNSTSGIVVFEFLGNLIF